MKSNGQKISLTSSLRLAFLLAAFLTIGADAARAATYTVTTNNDSVAGSLRQAILDANANAADDVINFDPAFFAVARTITLFNGQLTIANNGSLTINGTGANRLTINGSDVRRVFFVSTGANAAINNLTVTNGRANIVNPQAGSFGGGIYNDDGVLTLNCVAVRENVASGRGGGIFNAGTLNLNDSTVSGNSTGNLGGGIANLGGAVNLTNSTISGNMAAEGGGIFSNTTAAFSLNSVTVSFNTATDSGGGISNDTTINAVNSIIARNSASSAPDFRGTLASQGYNLIGSTSGTTVTGTTTGNILNQNPQLGVLQDNGGSTETHALLAGSPAIDKGNTALTADQRGLFRPSDNASIPNAANGADIGAFEVQAAPTAASVSIGGRVSTPTGRGLMNARVYLTDSSGNTRMILTTSFGYYRFTDVASGETYVLQVASKRYSFAAQVVSVAEDLTELNFTAQPQLKNSLR